MSNQDKPLTRIREIVQMAMKEKGITIDDVRADLAAYRRGEEYTYGQDDIKEDCNLDLWAHAENNLAQKRNEYMSRVNIHEFIDKNSGTFFSDMLEDESKLIESAKLLKSPEITLDSPEKVERFNRLLNGKGKLNDELIQKIKNTPTIPRRKKREVT